MHRSPPALLIVSTVAFFVLANLVLAQAIVLALYPDAGLRLGPAAIIALALLAAVIGLYAARGWHRYLRRRHGD